MGDVRISLDRGAITRLLRGRGAKEARHEAADRVKANWEARIHPRTGETQLLLSVEDGGGFAHDIARGADSRTYILTGQAGPEAHQDVNASAWKWLEYGTSKMEAQAPARNALREAAR
jgi:hypothetical protein